MLDRVDLQQTIGKTEFQQRLPQLQQRLYDLEVELIAAKIPVVLVFEGWAGTSKIGTIGAITRRLDPRGLRLHPITPPNLDEREYPWLHRFWQRIPAYGQLAVFDRSWYREIVAARSTKKLTRQAYLERCEDIVTFERQLSDDGAILLKFLLHISKGEQQRRFDAMLADRLTAIQVTKADLWQQRHYERVLGTTDDLIARTNTVHGPWIVVPATDRGYTQLTVLETIIHRIDQRIHAYQATTVQPTVMTDSRAPEQITAPLAPPKLPYVPLITVGSVLSTIDLAKSIDEDDYSQKLAKLQAKLYLLGLTAFKKKRPVIIVFEGWDAAGKGGTIKRITEPLDPRSYVVHAIGKPEGEDKQHHYLYRFWQRLPRAGQVAIFDRSWYGRVLVERVEGFARFEEWQRAYGEINEFEHQLIDFGAIILKFWLHISPEEQLRRFEERQSVRYKAWKLTEEDWRNREKWDQYEQAVDDMVLRTSTPYAPWALVASENKQHGRIQAIREVVRRLEDELGKIKL